MLRVRVPATTANLGSGFDCLGLALKLFNTVSIERSLTFGISVTGQGEKELPRDESNLVYRAVQEFYRAVGMAVPCLRIDLTNEVPLGRGLGSSAAAVIGGLVAANALNGGPLSEREVLGLASGLEGHSDNVAAALFGGLVVSTRADDDIEWARLPILDGVRAVAFIPDFQMPTDQARSVLPVTVSRGDAVFNIGRASLLVAAFATGRLDLLTKATEDRLHQRYRQKLFPSLESFLDGASRAGAIGAFLSGAGSTVLALTRVEDVPEVSKALLQVAEREGISGRLESLELCNEGVQFTD